MANKRLKPEEIVSKLRQVEVLMGQANGWFSAFRPLVQCAANGSKEPEVTNAAPRPNGSFRSDHVSDCGVHLRMYSSSFATDNSNMQEDMARASLEKLCADTNTQM